MQDNEIVKLYLERDDSAISQTEEKYSGYCRAIAGRILVDTRDVDECLNDTYLRAWNSIPPKKPQNLAVYLGKIVRNLSFDRYRKMNAEKRGGTQTKLILDELSEITNGTDETYENVNRREISKTINTFLDMLPAIERNVFILRYWYAYSVEDIAKRQRKTEGSISVSLSRTRKKLKEYLTERGFDV